MRVKFYFFSNNDKVVTSIWGIGSLGNSSAVLACLWDVILAVGHCLTGILRAILKNSKKCSLQTSANTSWVIPSWRPYMASDSTGELFLMFQWKLIMEKKGEMKVTAATLTWHQTNQAGRHGYEHHPLSLQPHWWAPRVPSLCASLYRALQAPTMEVSVWKGRCQSTQPRMENSCEAALVKNRCFLQEEALGVRNFMKQCST